MDIQIKGGQVLSGEITPSGSKNSALAVLAATLLFDQTVTLENIPNLSDVKALVEILKKLGSRIDWETNEHRLIIDNKAVSFRRILKEDLANMKGTAMMWGAMLARFKRTDFEELPGGCALGTRPADTHFKAFRDLGVKVTETASGVTMDASHAQAGEIWLTEMSPTATANAIMLATTLPGKTRLIGAAAEPSVQDVCQLLLAAGAKINGLGSSVLEIEGNQPLQGVKHRILSDHYEIATFLALGACTGNGIWVNEAMPEYFPTIRQEFSKFNVKINYQGQTAIVPGKQRVSMGEDIGKTIVLRPQPWPSLPVDMLPLFIPLALEAPRGSALFHNWMYESGLFWTNELLKFGANVIVMDPHRVITIAGNPLKGTTVVAPYIIRATVALIMVALTAEGKSTILNADSLDRGHEGLMDNLKKLGAVIERVD